MDELASFPANLPDSQLLEAAFLPAGPGLEPSIVLYPVGQLSPGQWRRAEESLDIPDHARRLTLPIAGADGESAHFLPTRALAVREALPFLLSLGTAEVRPSVRAWQLAAHVARRQYEGAMPPLGDPKVEAQLGQLAKAMPAASHAVLVESTGADDDLLATDPTGEQDAFERLTAHAALTAFLESAARSYVVGEHIERSVAKRARSKELQYLRLQLEMPTRAEAPWLLRIRFSEDEPGDDPAPRMERRQRLLEKAASMFSPLAGRYSTDEEPIELSVDEASTLVTIAPDLQARGAVVELPSALLRDAAGSVDVRMRLRESTSSGRSGSGTTPRFRLDDLVAYDLRVALGDREVDAAELQKLARQSRALIQLGGEWIALTDQSRDQLERLARAVEARDATIANSRALAAALGGKAQLAGGIVATVDQDIGDGRLRRALDFLRQPERFPQIDPTDGFTGELRHYQQRGLDWLAGMNDLGLGACLADDMGLGKTVQVIALMTSMRTRLEHMRLLVVCPTSLIGNWQRELERFAPGLDVHVHHGPQRVARASMFGDAEVIVTSYGLVARDRGMFSEMPFDLVVFDEAQAVKNADTEQARACRRLSAAFRVALTGTPMENRLLELWAILDLLNPGLLGTASVFRRQYAIPIERSSDQQAADMLRAITRPFLLRRVKHDPQIVPDLPEKQEHTIACTLTPEQAALYQATVDAALGDVRSRDGISRRGAVLALLTRLKQVCNHPLQALGDAHPNRELSGRSGKLARLESMLEEIVAEGERALVFTQYAQMGHLLNGYLPDLLGCEVLYLHGGVPRIQREQLLARFQDEQDDRPMVFVLSLKAGGLGLNLMQASHVFHYDRWWNPAVEDQATDRTHRIGQTRNIQVHKLVCAGTLEERIAAIIDDKRALAGRVIEVSNAGEGWITELSDDEIEALVSLSASDSVSLERTT